MPQLLKEGPRRLVAWQTNTPIVIVRDGVIVEERITERPEVEEAPDPIL